jgi:hypothetical protein
MNIRTLAMIVQKMQPILDECPIETQDAIAKLIQPEASFDHPDGYALAISLLNELRERKTRCSARR